MCSWLGRAKRRRASGNGEERDVLPGRQSGTAGDWACRGGASEWKPPSSHIAGGEASLGACSAAQAQAAGMGGRPKQKGASSDPSVRRV